MLLYLSVFYLIDHCHNVILLRLTTKNQLIYYLCNKNLF